MDGAEGEVVDHFGGVEKDCAGISAVAIVGGEAREVERCAVRERRVVNA